jgi:hypothetical protein
MKTWIVGVVSLLFTFEIYIFRENNSGAGKAVETVGPGLPAGRRGVLTHIAGIRSRRSGTFVTLPYPEMNSFRYLFTWTNAPRNSTQQNNSRNSRNSFVVVTARNGSMHIEHTDTLLY